MYLIRSGVVVAQPSCIRIRFLSQSPTDTTNSTGVAPPSLQQELSHKRIAEELKSTSVWTSKESWNPDMCRATVSRYEEALLQLSDDGTAAPSELTSAETLNSALKTLLKCRYDPSTLASKVRLWERQLGKLKQTPLTDHVSLRLLTVNGKAGNVGRTLSLLQLRQKRKYEPREREFIYAITSLQAAHSKPRNIFQADREQSVLDNPTRWLDAILMNMHVRGFPLTTSIANRMLLTYASGKTGKAVHHFYRVKRQPIAKVEKEDRPEESVAEMMPKDWYNVPDDDFGHFQPAKIKIKYHTRSPPYYKVPSKVRGSLMDGRSKLDREMDPTFSVPLAAAFAFAESLQHGACGHPPIVLNTGSYNALIKACVYRGALFRAMHVLDTMPSKKCEPNIISYNLILAGLANVGDTVTARDYYLEIINKGLEPDPFTVRALVDGLLNLGDMQSAVTVVQDIFNQHLVLPPYTTHLKILELCLASDMIFEAKRHVYFIQQLWKWEANQYHPEKVVKLIEATKRNTQLQKPALQRLFNYFGEDLPEADFF